MATMKFSSGRGFQIPVVEIPPTQSPVVEASMIDLAPGHFPSQLVVTIDGHEGEYREVLYLTSLYDAEERPLTVGEDVAFAFYQSRLGTIALTVLND